MVHGSGFRVYGLGFIYRVYGLRFWVLTQLSLCDQRGSAP